MSTPSAPEPPDARDPRTAEWLAVEPLDEVTRTRLVRAALAETDAAPTPGHAVADEPDRSPNRAFRFFAVAAALLMILVVGIAVLVPRGSDESTPTASDLPSAERVAPEAAQAPASDPSGSSGSSGATAPADAAAPLSPIGSLGDVSTKALLRAKARSLRDPLFAQPTVLPLACAVEAARALGVPVAAGTGTVAGEPATVILVERAERRGTLASAIVVVDRSCRPGPSVRLR